MNHVVAETDPLGRTTRAEYDAAGRQTSQTDATGRRTDVDVRRLRPRGVDQRRRCGGLLDRAQPPRAPRHRLRPHPRRRRRRRARAWSGTRAASWSAAPATAAPSRGSTTPTAAGTAMTTPDGTRTSYIWDAAGRLQGVDHPLLGRATFERDAAGRLVAATADGVIQTWEHRDGWVVAHTVGDGDGFTRTAVQRDDEGRVLRVDRDGVSTSYDYDEARQLVEARTGGTVVRVALRRRRPSRRRVRRRRHDRARLRRRRPAAHQHRRRGRPDLHLRRGRAAAPGSSATTDRRASWSGAGPAGSAASPTTTPAAPGAPRCTWTPWPSSSASTTPRCSGTPRRRTARRRCRPATSRCWPPGRSPAWADPGRPPAGAPPAPRTVRRRTPGPWAPPSDLARCAGNRRRTGVLGIGAAGELSVGGLEWLGARVYDPASRGFLSVDPLDPVPGAGWAGNPYSYAGNDPLHALDPMGLRPVTDAELKAYAAQHAGAISAAGDFMKDNWEYVAGGAMVVAGGVLIATGVGGPARHDAGRRRCGHDHPEGHHRRRQLGPGRDQRRARRVRRRRHRCPRGPDGHPGRRGGRHVLGRHQRRHPGWLLLRQRTGSPHRGRLRAGHRLRHRSRGTDRRGGRRRRARHRRPPHGCRDAQSRSRDDGDGQGHGRPV